MLRTRLSLVQFQRQASGNANGNKIRRVLIANRGEIACRVMKTAKKLGIESVAVYSSADVHSQHTKMADKAFRIGEPSPLQSYLRGERIIEVALKAGAQAIHPGYGFLSENAGFAEECAKNGLIFMGPPPHAIRDMGMKNTAKKIMIEAKVPVIEGYNGDDQSPELLLDEAKKIGFPVMIKAVCGGGGKGMRIAKTEADFHQALESAKTESDKAFGNSAMIIEKYVERPRHVEIQVFGDQHDNYVYLWERDCSIQRRHQKVIEEAPAPGLSTEVRRRIGEAGANAAKAVQYTGAGTVEFIMDPLTQKFYFMEMNTRLQVEHPVTEAITGVDLVEWQFIVAEGGRIPLKQEEIQLNGHALEARVYAEDSQAGFMPTAGKLEHLQFPTNARIDSGVVEGDEVTVHYDPMIAKVIVWGRDRPEAIANLDAALNNTHIGGLANNVDFVRTCLNHPKFGAAEIYTDFIADHEAELLPKEKKKIATESLVEGVVARLLLANGTRRPPSGPFSAKDWFRVNYRPEIQVDLDENTKIRAKIEAANGEISEIRIEDKVIKVCEVERSETETTGLPLVRFRVELDGKMWPVKAVQLKEGLQVFGSEQREWPISSEAPDFDEQSATGGDLQARSPMPGVIDKVFVEVGDVVKAGQAVVVMIAMKMEYVLKAPFDCTVEAVNCTPGKNVGKHAVLVKYHKEE